MALCRRTLGSERHRYAIARPDKLGTDSIAVGGIHRCTPSRKAGGISSVRIRFGLSVENEQADAGRGGRTHLLATPILATPLWGMLYADEAGVVSQSLEQSWKTMGVIVVVCAAFGLTVREAKTEIIVCLRTKGCRSPPPYSAKRQRARWTTKPTSSYTSGGTSTTMPTCPSRSTGAYATHGAASVSTPLNCTADLAFPSSSKPDAKSRGNRDNAVRLRHEGPAREPLRHATPSPSQLPDSLNRLAKEQSCRSPDFLSGHAYQDRK